MPAIEFQNPLALLLPVLLPALLVLRRKTRRKLPHPAVTPDMAVLRPGFWKRNYNGLLFGLVYLCLCLSLANPGYSRETVEEFIESKWLFLALDLSGSMKRPVSRFSNQTLGDLALDGISYFVDMRRDEDYIGLVAFSSYARLLAPLTFDKKLLKTKLELVRSRNQSRIYRELGAGGGTNASEAVWLALSAFFSMLPEQNRLSVEQIAGMREFLLGAPGALLDIPQKIRDAGLGTGMAVILFTDGRIEPTLRAHVKRGRLPNLVNLITLMKAVGIHFYIITVGGEVDQAVEQAMQPAPHEPAVGRIFATSRGLTRAQIEEVYREIDALETNRNLTRIILQRRWTRRHFAWLALAFMALHLLLRSLPGWRKL
jgi:hypothetical protein